MLILRRKAGQTLQIGEDITISVVSVDSSSVRLSISAPNDVSILRGELVAAKLANQDAATEEATPESLLSLFDSIHPDAVSPLVESVKQKGHEE